LAPFHFTERRTAMKKTKGKGGKKC